MTVDHRGRTALVTGASSGLGARFAHVLAARGADLVLVARRADRLSALAAELREAHGVRAEALPFDLAEPGAGAALREAVSARGMTVHTLINNAGFATYGPFVEADPARIRAEIQLDVLALVDLARAFLPDLAAAGGGALVNVASTASFQPVPNMAVYAAAKGFVLSFTEAIAYELRGTGVRVLALCPGATQTEFFDVVGDDRASVGERQTPAQVVATAMRALDRPGGPAFVVSGASNRLGALFSRLVPRALAVSATARVMRGA